MKASVIVFTVFAIGLCIRVMIEGVDYQLAIFIADVEDFCHVFLGVVMALDVLLHVLVGQTLEGGLVALGSLAGDGHNLVVGVVLASHLELFILGTAELGGSGSEGLGQLDGTILSIDGDSGHGSYLFLSDSLGSLFFYFRRCCWHQA